MRFNLAIFSLFSAASVLLAANTKPVFLNGGIINGCQVSVLDLGARSVVTADQRVLVEPLMCVTTNPNNLLPSYDPVLRRSYLSVPVLLRDNEILNMSVRYFNKPELNARSMQFASVAEIQPAEDDSPPSAIVALDFLWTPPQPVGYLWLGCRIEDRCQEILRTRQTEAIRTVQLSATLLGRSVNDSMRFNYRLTVQNETSTAANDGSRNYIRPPICPRLRAIESIESGNCAAYVYQRLDRKGHYVIEPLLCYEASEDTALLTDQLRGTNYLQLTLLLQNSTVLSKVKTRLEYLRPISVEFMKLWRAKAVVDDEFSRRYYVGQLCIRQNSRSAIVQVHCTNLTDCTTLRCALKTDPIYLWRHIKWNYEAIVDDTCLHVPITGPKNSWQVRQEAKVIKYSWLSSLPCKNGSCKHSITRGSKEYIVMMQRLRGSFSFQRNWTEYENGFGDETDFWIGLAAAHTLSKLGVNLRIELKLWNSTELFGEFTKFRIENSSTNYRMTYSRMLTDAGSGNISFDPLAAHKGMQFSTMDRDNDANENSCSANWGRGGWWFNSCYDFYPTGQHPGRKNIRDYRYMTLGDIQQWSIQQVRLLLEKKSVC